jgi:hypothetical protein
MTAPELDQQPGTAPLAFAIPACEVSAEVGGGISVGITSFRSAEDPDQNLVYVQAAGALSIVAMNRDQALELANVLIKIVELNVPPAGG